MKNLLLVSSSNLHGTGYLDHCEAAARELFAGVRRVLFVPYAGKDRDGYTATAAARFAAMGLGLDGVHAAADPRAAAEEAEAVFIGGGNTFRLLKSLYDTGLVEVLRRRAEAGMPYMGTSAGSNVACLSIRTTNDMPIVFPPTFEALGLAPFHLNPHYIAPDPSSTHMGETRDQRIAEFHEENESPVVGVMEGGWIRVRGAAMTLDGVRGGRLFRRGAAPRDLAPGTDLAALLAGR